MPCERNFKEEAFDQLSKIREAKTRDVSCYFRLENDTEVPS